MSKGLTPNQKAEVAKSELKERLLLEIDHDTNPIKILANDTLTQIVIDGDTYIGACLTRGDIQTSSEMQVDRCQVSISNINQAISAVIASEGDTYTNLPARLMTVIFNGDPPKWQANTAYTATQYIAPTSWNGYIYKCSTGGTTSSIEPTWGTVTSGTTSSGGAEFTCESPFLDDPILLIEGKVNNIKLNQTVFTFDIERSMGGFQANTPNTTYDVNCQWKFKDVRCGYTGAETKCDKSLIRCKALSNVENFGGYPAIVVPAKIHL